jgi:MFS family permease
VFFAALAVALSLVAPSPNLFYAVFVASALASAGVGIAGNNIVMEFAGTPQRIPLYTVFYNAATALPRAAAPLLGGFIADQAGYTGLFGVALALGLAALLMSLGLPEPREDAAREP